MMMKQQLESGMHQRNNYTREIEPMIQLSINSIVILFLVTIDCWIKLPSISFNYSLKNVTQIRAIFTQCDIRVGLKFSFFL